VRDTDPNRAKGSQHLQPASANYTGYPSDASSSIALSYFQYGVLQIDTASQWA